MKTTLILLFTLVTLSLAGQINAALVVLSSSDPINDQFGSAPDLTGMTFVFDSITGGYTIDLQTTDENPFVGEFRININLYNLDAGTSAQDPSYFQDTVNDYNLTATTTTLRLTGTNTRLLAWEAGDEILLNNWLDGAPSPEGSILFRSGVLGFPLGSAFTNEDMLGVEGQTDVLSAVPIPAAAWLFGSGLIALAALKRRKR